MIYISDGSQTSHSDNQHCDCVSRHGVITSLSRHWGTLKSENVQKSLKKSLKNPNLQPAFCWFLLLSRWVISSIKGHLNRICKKNWAAEFVGTKKGDDSPILIRVWAVAFWFHHFFSASFFQSHVWKRPCLPKFPWNVWTNLHLSTVAIHNGKQLLGIGTSCIFLFLKQGHASSEQWREKTEEKLWDEFGLAYLFMHIFTHICSAHIYICVCVKMSSSQNLLLSVVQRFTIHDSAGNVFMSEKRCARFMVSRADHCFQISGPHREVQKRLPLSAEAQLYRAPLPWRLRPVVIFLALCATCLETMKTPKNISTGKHNLPSQDWLYTANGWLTMRMPSPTQVQRSFQGSGGFPSCLQGSISSPCQWACSSRLSDGSCVQIKVRSLYSDFG